MLNIWYVSKAIHNFDFSFFFPLFLSAVWIRFLSVPYSKILFIWLSHGRNVQLTSFANLAQCSLVVHSSIQGTSPKRKHESRKKKEKKTFELTFGVHVPQVCTFRMAVDSSVKSNWEPVSSSRNAATSSSKFVTECLSCVLSVGLCSGYVVYECQFVNRKLIRQMNTCIHLRADVRLGCIVFTLSSTLCVCVYVHRPRSRIRNFLAAHSIIV